MQLQNKTILVTGANRGIGRAIAEELAKQPVHLLLGMRDTSSYKTLDSTEALSITPVQIDLSSKDAINKSVKKLGDTAKKIDILINNAGQFTAGPLQEQDMDKVYAMFQVNIVGLAHLTHLLLPSLLKRKEAKIVNNASIAGYAYLPDNSTYSATKAGVVAFSEALRRELETTDVSVLHLVTPAVDTSMLQDVEATYARNKKPVKLGKVSAAEWAQKTVKAIESDKTVLTPNGSTGVLRVLSRGPHWLVDAVSRKMFKK
jgi:short-subunit dehydrogenase